MPLPPDLVRASTELGGADVTVAPPPHLGAGPRDSGDLTAKVNTGLRRICGRRTVALGGIGRDAFAHSLAGHWQSVLSAWHAGEWPALREEWQARAHPRGTLLGARDPELGPITGAFAGLDDTGAALLRLADGTCRAIHAGDIDEAGRPAL